MSWKRIWFLAAILVGYFVALIAILRHFLPFPR